MTRVLVVGGLDPSGRAGLAADLHAVHALGAVAAPIATSLTAQGGRRYAAQPVGPAWLARELEAAVKTGPVDAVKVGAMPDRRHLAALVRAVAPLEVPVVVDPVVRTSRGERLSRLTPADFAWAARALGRVVLTPNADEWAWLGEDPRPFFAVVVKGGATATDTWLRPDGRGLVFRGSRLHRSPIAHRGTGCRFGSALAVGLGAGATVPRAVRLARRIVRTYLRASILG